MREKGMIMNQVCLPVADIATAAAFYRKLGFLQIVDAPHYARFACEGDGPTFSLEVSERGGSSGATIYFETPALDERVAELRAKGIEFEQLPTDQPWLWREAVLHDPSGNRIKLYYAGENRLNPPWRVELRE
jgi:catechol 2,3-dioxygenase-like lactoylglutathione lyase family enzyme